MVAKSSVPGARKSAPRSVQASPGSACVEAPLSIEERAASAVKARAYGANPAPEGVSPSFWERECAETFRFDVEHAESFVELHDHFCALYRGAYGRAYPRTVHHEWRVLRELVRELGHEYAYVVIDRCFDEDELVEAGIDSTRIVANWAHVALRPSKGGRSKRPRSRLTCEERDLLRSVVEGHAVVEAGGAP